MARKKKAGNNKKTIALVKAEYICGEKSLRTLAAEHKISESKLFRYSTKDSWRKAREEYRSKVTAEAIASAQTRAVNDVSEVLALSKTLAGEVRLALGDPKQLYRRIVADKDGKLIERDDFTKIDANAVKNLASAIEKLAGTMERLSGRDDATTTIVMNDVAKEYSE